MEEQGFGSRQRAARRREKLRLIFVGVVLSGLSALAPSLGQERALVLFLSSLILLLTTLQRSTFLYFLPLWWFLTGLSVPRASPLLFWSVLTPLLILWLSLIHRLSQIEQPLNAAGGRWRPLSGEAAQRAR